MPAIAIAAAVAAAYRAAADEIDGDNDCTCDRRYTCPACRITDRLRARADEMEQQ